ncbi:protein P54-like [Oryza brachyantha]|uniref:protein P54-like n=1 Tax=Oryza brachyantha TaxID=4533 RepID=UPI001AD99D70|nr:protein P54-like [Oryza brachyantha]
MVAAGETPPNPSATTCRAEPAPSRKIRLRIKPIRVAALEPGEDAGRVAERRRVREKGELSTSTTERRREGEEGNGASKDEEASETEESVSCISTTTSPEAAASCKKEETTLPGAHAAVRDDAPCDQEPQDRREEAAEGLQERARTRSSLTPSATTCLAEPAPSRKIRIRIKPFRVAAGPGEDAGRVAERRRACEKEPLSASTTKCRSEGEEGSGASKEEEASEPEAAACKKEETTVGRAHAAISDDDATATPHTIKKRKTSERSEENDREGATQCTRMSSPCVQPSPASPPSPSPAARPDPDAAENSLRAAIDKARPLMRRDVTRQREREAARRELAKVVRTVEFNDPYISPQDVFKP